MKLGTEQIAGMTVDVEADRTGRFFITKDGDQLGMGDTLEKAKSSARAKLARLKTKVSVPFAMADGRRGVADGRHARNRTILATIDGKREDVGTGYRSNSPVLRNDISDDLLQRLVELDEEIYLRQQEFNSIVKDYELDLGKAVDAAIQEAIVEREAKGATA